ncbi:MAG: DUF370 domain-containing protein [Gemmiger sp.]|nr:DUF370 domain-containing protein [Gemmiger sp.]
MYLHVGQDFILDSRSIVGIFDLDTTSPGRITHEFLDHAEREGAVVTISEALPKSFIVTDFPAETVYVSALATGTLKSRAEKFDVGL